MSRTRRGALVLAVITAVLTTQALILGTASGNPGGKPGVAGQPFTGIDGQVHDPADFILDGKYGTKFLGQEFDMLCGAGKAFNRGLRRMQQLAEVIERSGRHAVFGIAPDKSSITKAALPSPLPHGKCSRQGMRQDAEFLDGIDSPLFADPRKQLRITPYSYWKTDSHWNTVGASIYAQAVARTLSRKLARKQQYLDTTRTKVGDMIYPEPPPVPETAPARIPANGVVTVPALDSPAYDPTLQRIYLELAWDSSPARKTWPGKTLFLGDSFTYTALESLANLTEHGRFLWLGYHDNDEVAQAIKESDTVVITVVQRFASGSQGQSPSLLKTVTKALRPRR